jgi:dTDP-4-dehydrorhamnose reductase
VKKITVLGINGMLGSMVYGYLRKNPSLHVIGTDRRTFDAQRFLAGESQKADLQGDTIINCIGIIKPFCKDTDPAGVINAIEVNALFPHRLAAEAKLRGTRIIQIATDCVYSGTKGNYIETDPHDALDVYGKSKSLGEVFDRSVLNIRCSIIGPETKSRVSLLEWCLGNQDGAILKGFAHHHWNGVTTLQFAKLCEKLVLNDELYAELINISAVHHFIPNSTVDKFELLNLIAQTYRRKFEIVRVDDIGPAVDRTLATKFGILSKIYSAQSMEEALTELKAYSE